MTNFIQNVKNTMTNNGWEFVAMQEFENWYTRLTYRKPADEPGKDFTFGFVEISSSEEKVDFTNRGKTQRFIKKDGVWQEKKR